MRTNVLFSIAESMPHMAQLTNKRHIHPLNQMATLPTFFASHPVFTSEEVTRFHRLRGSGNPGTLRVLLMRHHRRGRLVAVRRGVYASVPAGQDASTVAVDAYQVASRLAPDAVLGYHTALELHGVAHSVFSRLQFLTDSAARACTFRDLVFQPVRVPRALAGGCGFGVEVERVDRMGLSIRVTTLERTCVDSLDRPDLAGGWEEVMQSIESADTLDVDAVIRYALHLRSATLAAKVGWYLEINATRLCVSASQLDRLRAHRPKARQYINRESPQGHRLARGWNLLLPTDLAEQRWREVG